MTVVWDPAKALANLRKHRVSFSDAEGVLFDPAAVTVDDVREGERRFVTIGLDALGRVVVVVYTCRAEALRIISARRATRGERNQ